jgi:hypothetical protein
MIRSSWTARYVIIDVGVNIDLNRETHGFRERAGRDPPLRGLGESDFILTSSLAVDMPAA